MGVMVRQTQQKKKKKPSLLPVVLRRTLLYPVVFTLGVLLVTSLTVMALITSERGSEWLLKQVNAIPSIKLTWRNFSGSLWRGITLDDSQLLIYSNEEPPQLNTSLSVNRFQLRWQWSALLGRQFTIQQLLVDHLQIVQLSSAAASPEPSEPAPWPEITLPIQLTLENMELKNGVYFNHAADPLIQRVTLGAVWKEDELTIQPLRVSHALGTVQLSSHLRLSPPYPMEVRLLGEGSIAERLIDAQAFSDNTLPWNLTLNLSGNRDRLLLKAESQLSMPFQISGNIKTGLDRERIQWRPSAASAAIDLAWQALQWPPNAESPILKTHGQMNFDGSLQQFVAQLQTEIEGQAFAKQTVTLHIEGEPESLTLKQLHAAGDAGDIDGQMRLSWSDQVAFRSELSFNQLNIAALGKDVLAEWPSRISGSLALDATNSSTLVGREWADLLAAAQTIPAWEGTLRFNNLGGSIRGYPFRLSGSTSLDGRHQIEMDAVRLQQGDNVATLDVTTELPSFPLDVSHLILPPTEATWSLKANNLQQVLPSLSGQLNVQGALAFAFPQPWDFTQLEALLSERGIQSLESTVDFFGSVQAHHLKYQDNALGVGKIDWNLGHLSSLNAQQTPPSMAEPKNNEPLLTLHLQDLTLPSGRLSTASLKATGELTHHSINARVTADPAIWLPPSGEKDTASTPLALSINVAQRIKGDQWLGQLLPTDLSQSQPFLPKNTTLTGEVLGEWQASLRSLGDLEGAVQLRDLDWTLMPSEQWSAQQFHVNTFRVNGKKSGRWVQGQVKGELLGDGQIASRFKLKLPQPPKEPDLTSKTATSDTVMADGWAKIDFPSLAWLDPFVEAAQDLDGRFSSELTLKGSLQQPNVAGFIAIDQAATSLPSIGVAFKDFNIKLQRSMNKEQPWQLSGSSQATRGTLDFSGYLDIANLPQWQADVLIKGHQFSALNLPDMSMDVSPNLRIEADASRLSVTGDVAVDEAEIAVHTVPAGSVQPTSDEVIIGGDPLDSASKKENKSTEGDESKGGDESSLSVQSDVTIRLSDQVYFSGFGLTGQLIGQLGVKSLPEKPLEANGQLRIQSGIYESFGQRLSIDRGLMLFQGPVDRPLLDIQASRLIKDAQEKLVGMKIRGEPNALSTTLFSQPTLPEADILSLLLTGRTFSVDDKGSDDNAMLLNAVASLGISQGGGLMKQLQDSTGLDVLSLDSSDGVENSSVTVGKYITPDLFISYVRNLLNPTTSVQFEYRLTPKLKVQAESGEGQSVDVLYEFNSKD